MVKCFTKCFMEVFLVLNLILKALQTPPNYIAILIYKYFSKLFLLISLYPIFTPFLDAVSTRCHDPRPLEEDVWIRQCSFRNVKSKFTKELFEH